MNNSYIPPTGKTKPEFHVASQLSGGGDYRVIYAWRTGSNMVTLRFDVGHHRGDAKHYGIEKARQCWRDNKGKGFQTETAPLDWDLIHDILPLH